MFSKKYVLNGILINLLRSLISLLHASSHMCEIFASNHFPIETVRPDFMLNQVIINKITKLIIRTYKVK